MARSGQRRGATALPARELRSADDEDGAYQPRYSPLSDLAHAQLRALSYGADDFIALVKTEKGRVHFRQIHETIERELHNRGIADMPVQPGAFLRGTALIAIAEATTDPVDPIPLRYAALALSCLADQAVLDATKEMDITLAAVGFALAGDARSAGHLLHQHDIDLDDLPLSSRFSIATLVPEMRGQLMGAFDPGSMEFSLLSMIEENADHFQIRDLHEQISAITGLLEQTVLELFLFRLARKRLYNYAYRSSRETASRSVSRPEIKRLLTPGWAKKRPRR